MRVILTFEEAQKSAILMSLLREAGLSQVPALGLEDIRAMALVNPSWVKIQEDQQLVVLSVDPTTSNRVLDTLARLGRDNMALFTSAVGLIEALAKNLAKGMEEVKGLFR